jgi:hypothetical protein
MSTRKATLAGLATALCALAGTIATPVALGDETETCPNATLRTGASAHLADCRAYELVTPPVKYVSKVGLYRWQPEGSTAVIEIGGTALPGTESFYEFDGAPEAFYQTERTPAGWTYKPLGLPASEYEASQPDLVGLSADLQTTVWAERGAWQRENEVDLFLRGSDRSIGDVGPTLGPTAAAGSVREVAYNLHNVKVSSDASHVFFQLGNYFWPGDGTPLPGPHGEVFGESLYEYIGTGNATPMLVGVNDEGAQIGQCGDEFNASSADGATVLFTVKQQGHSGCQGKAPLIEELFARIDNGLPNARTVAISEPSQSDCAACKNEARTLAPPTVGSQVISEDGSKVFFQTTQPLLGDDSSNNIYEYDFDAPGGEKVVRVSAGDATVSDPRAEVGTTASLGANAQGSESVRVSEDGSHVYFIAHGVLTRTPNQHGESAEAGANNLYVYEQDATYPTGRISFVTHLASNAEASNFDLTPDGRFLVFASSRDLTPDDTSTAEQVFEYDAQTGVLIRVSTGRDGFNHNGNASANPNPLTPGGEQGGNYNDARIPREHQGSGYDPENWTRSAVSADGSYIFFESTVGLTPQALNEVVAGYTGESKLPIYANNVYEYHDGQVSLISDGQDIAHEESVSAVQLLGTDASGADVFFATADRLTGQDSDGLRDIYDARIDGGFPPPPVSSSCSGDACQGPLGAAPTLLSPGSELQAGGNPPLAVAPPVSKTPTKKKAVAKHKKRHARKRKPTIGRRGRRGKKATATVLSRQQRKAGRS